MNLSAYRSQSGMSQQAAADWFGASKRQVIRWEKRESIPSPRMQAKIKRLTKGQVSAEDWVDGAEHRAPKRRA
jgi:DNA-binding transcriptional regulator YiaG